MFAIFTAFITYVFGTIYPKNQAPTHVETVRSPLQSPVALKFVPSTNVKTRNTLFSPMEAVFTTEKPKFVWPSQLIENNKKMLKEKRAKKEKRGMFRAEKEFKLDDYLQALGRKELDLKAQMAVF
jgi:hypothetical protein